MKIASKKTPRKKEKSLLIVQFPLKKTLIIDNYDSFTYNLFQLIAQMGGNPVVYKNDHCTLSDIQKLAPTHIILSPGPGSVENTSDFGICREIIEELSTSEQDSRRASKKILRPIPLLGVCLGHQGIIHAFGGKIVHAPTIMHGKQSLIEHTDSKLFKDIPNPFLAMRYHSLCGSSEHFPAELQITAWSKDDHTIMGIEHSTLPIFGVQFHPESFGTPSGKVLMNNFFNLQSS